MRLEKSKNAVCDAGGCGRRGEVRIFFGDNPSANIVFCRECGAEISEKLTKWLRAARRAQEHE